MKTSKINIQHIFLRIYRYVDIYRCLGSLADDQVGVSEIVLDKSSKWKNPFYIDIINEKFDFKHHLLSPEKKSLNYLRHVGEF